MKKDEIIRIPADRDERDKFLDIVYTFAAFKALNIKYEWDGADALAFSCPYCRKNAATILVRGIRKNEWMCPCGRKKDTWNIIGLTQWVLKVGYPKAIQFLREHAVGYLRHTPERNGT